MEADTEIDRYYSAKRKDAQDHPDKFFPSYKTILQVMFPDTTEGSLLNFRAPLQILDVCMAPGGLTHAILSGSENARVTETSLPVEAGGYEMRSHGVGSLDEFPGRWKVFEEIPQLRLTPNPLWHIRGFDCRKRSSSSSTGCPGGDDDELAWCCTCQFI